MTEEFIFHWNFERSVFEMEKYRPIHCVKNMHFFPFAMISNDLPGGCFLIRF